MSLGSGWKLRSLVPIMVSGASCGGEANVSDAQTATPAIERCYGTFSTGCRALRTPVNKDKRTSVRWLCRRACQHRWLTPDGLGYSRSSFLPRIRPKFIRDSSLPPTIGTNTKEEKCTRGGDKNMATKIALCV